MTALKSLVLLVAITMAAPEVHAEDERSHSVTGAEETEPLWIGADAKAAEFEALMEVADGLALRSIHYHTPPDRKADFAEASMRAYEKAIALNPQSAEAHLRAAMVSEEFQTAGNFPRKPALNRAIGHLEEFERLAPLDPRLPDQLFRRSILRTKRTGKDNLEKGVADYDAQLALLNQSDPLIRGALGNILSNRAELLMMLGRLEEAIAGYERALEFGSEITHGYGLAVALDRDGQGFRARQVARKYALMDRGNALREGTTFYVPAGEVFYYEAIRAEGVADYRLAEAAYRAFIQRLPRSQFVAQARKNLAAIKSKAASQPLRRPGAGFPIRRTF